MPQHLSVSELDARRRVRQAEEERRNREEDGDEEDGGGGDGPPDRPEVDQSAPQQEPNRPLFWPAPDIEALAEELIGERRTVLRDANIVYAYTSAQHKRRGKPLVIDVKKVEPFARYLQEGAAENGADFAVIVSEKDWLARSNLRWRQAAMFDALCRMTTSEMNTKGDVAWALREHEIETFPEVIAAFGAWNEELAVLDETFKQLRMNIGGE